MIVSHRYRYVFVELPLTGSTAISTELRKNYDGVPMLFKHATYLDFLRVATPQERGYFTFSAIRNPLDQAVSHYFKYKNDHNGRFSRQSEEKARGIHNRLVRYVDQRRFQFIRKNDATFEEFFLKFYRWPYANWSVLCHKDFNHVIRFENLQTDFQKALALVGVESRGELPSVNRTSERSEHAFSYFQSNRAIHRAKLVFGPFMRIWGYGFPGSWGDEPTSWRHRAVFEAVTAARKLYWRFLRSRI